MRTSSVGLFVVLGVALLGSCPAGFGASSPFLGAWALTIPGGHAGWLGVREGGGGLQASMLWGWGSVEPVASATMDGPKLVLTRKHNVERKYDGKTVKTNIIEVINASVNNDRIQLTSRKPRLDQAREEVSEFASVRQTPMPPRPDLTKLRFGPPTELLNASGLSGWRLTDRNAVNGWSVRDGILANNPLQEEGKPHKSYGNLRTDEEFEDFNLRLAVRLPEKGNSGVYLRGIYEIQVADSFGQAPSSHGMGGLYSRIQPTKNPSKRPGEWQTMDLTLADQHVTVILNGEKIIDNQPAEGCTGGALWSDVSRPGPIYFQGDHTGVEYRNVVIRRILKDSRTR